MGVPSWTIWQQTKECRMSSSISRRELLSTGLAAVGSSLATTAFAAEDEKAPRRKGALTLEGLGKLLSAMGLKVTREKTQYNFTFPAKLDVEWNMTMSAVLSEDEESIWLMAWLNELPKSAADVPRTALLRLLAENDKMGKAFFAYMPSTRRFVLERVIDNEGITTESFKEEMLDLSVLVIETQSVWSVSEWKQSGSTPSDSAKDSKGTSEDAPGVLNSSGGAKSIKAAAKDTPAGGSSAPKKK
jgi:hypothetical protein